MGPHLELKIEGRDLTTNVEDRCELIGAILRARGARPLKLKRKVRVEGYLLIRITSLRYRDFFAASVLSSSAESITTEKGARVKHCLRAPFRALGS